MRIVLAINFYLFYWFPVYKYSFSIFRYWNDVLLLLYTVVEDKLAMFCVLLNCEFLNFDFGGQSKKKKTKQKGKKIDYYYNYIKCICKYKYTYVYVCFFKIHHRCYFLGKQINIFSFKLHTTRFSLRQGWQIRHNFWIYFKREPQIKSQKSNITSTRTAKTCSWSW